MRCRLSYELRKGGDKFPMHVIGADGSPDLALTIYASKADLRHSSATAKTYTRHLIAFAAWAASDPVALRQEWSLSGHPDAVRSLICRFLSVELKCTVALSNDKLGFETRRVECKWRGSKGDVTHLLAALRSYFELIIVEGLYAFDNPMVGTFSSELITQQKKHALSAFSARYGRNPMPKESGVDDYRWKRMSDSYFRQNGSAWEPIILDDPSLQQNVLDAGVEYGWSKGEICVARIMFDTGCRINEACSLRVCDWAASDFGSTIFSLNKGSLGERSKVLHLPDKTVKILRAHLTEDHPLSVGPVFDLAAKNSEALKVPLFVTRLGTQLSPDWYRRNSWTPALHNAGIRLRPHQVRHWFVTTAMALIDELSVSEEQRQTERNKLRLLMGWRTNMIPTYSHAINRKALPQLAARIHERVEIRQKSANLSVERSGTVCGEAGATSPIARMLTDLVGVS